MGAPYSSVAVSGYNANPPADDGSQVASNEVDWSTIKEKLPDPLKTAIESMNTNLLTAFAKVLGGAGVTSTATDYTIDGSSDQGKLIRASASGITITTPDATAVLSPWVCAILNNSSATITVDGSGSQTIDGNANITLPAGGGTVLFTDGANWFTNGTQGTLVGKQLMSGDIINGTLAESNGTNAVTFALKTLAGNDPSAADPVLLCFRNTTPGTGNYVYRAVTAALSLTVSSGSTIGFTSGVAAKLWIVLFDDAGTIRMGAINCLSGTNIYPLGQNPIASSTAEGGAGAADSAQVFYTGTAVSSKPYLILASATYESGVATAGSWNASPTIIRLFDRSHQLPGASLQIQRTATGAAATGTTTIPFDDTIPQITEGVQFLSQAITAISKANLLRVTVSAMLANNTVISTIGAVFNTDYHSTNAMIAVCDFLTGTGQPTVMRMEHWLQALTTSASTFTFRAGGASAGSTTLNGITSGPTRELGGVANSYIQVEEIVA